MKLLYANGCSMTYGEELDDPQTEAWPIIFANELGILNVKNDAISGSSNEKIFRKTMDFLSTYLERGNNPENLFVLVGWTYPSRREFYNTVSGVWQSFNSIVPRQTKEDIELQEAYYPNFSDERKDFERLLTIILSLQSFLLMEKIQFYFVSCLGKYDHLVDEYQKYSRLIRPETCVDFSDPNFHVWSMRNKFPMGVNRHPLKEAHREWGKLLYNHYSSFHKAISSG